MITGIILNRNFIIETTQAIADERHQGRIRKLVYFTNGAIVPTIPRRVHGPISWH